MKFDFSPISAWVLFAALLPIIIHMLNRLRYKTVHWAAMIFLLKANKAATRRAKLKQYLLLLFRALAIFFLVFALLRPKAGGWMGGSPEVIVLVLDRSSSMEARVSDTNPMSKREQALALFAEATKSAKGKTRFVLIENVLRQPTEVADGARIGAMQMGEPTDTAADIPAMMRAACDYLSKNQVGTAEVWVASDLQKSNWREGSAEWRDIKARFEALRDTRVVVLDLSSAPASNISVALKSAEFRPARTDGSPAAVEKGTLALALEARSYTSTGTFPLRITRDGATSQSDLILNAPVRRELMKIDIPKLPEGGGWGKIELPADDVLADNRVYFTYRRPVPLHTAVVTDQPTGRFFAAAAAPDRTRTDRSVEVVPPSRAGDIRWKNTALIIWQAPAPSEAVSKQLQAFVESGGILLAFPPGGEGGAGPLGISWKATENVKERVTNLDELDGPLARTDNGSPLPVDRLQVMRRQVPVIASDSRHIYAMFSDQRDFLVGQPLGAGQILACATPPDAEWSTLDEGFVMLPMVQRLLAEGGSRLAPPANAIVGEWQPPTEEMWTSVETEGRHDARWHAGVYKSNGRLIALNRSPIEESPDISDEAEIKRLIPKMTLEKVLKLDSKELETEIGPFMIVLTMAFMCLEMLIAMSKSLLPKQKPKVPVPATAKKEEGVTV